LHVASDATPARTKVSVSSSSALLYAALPRARVCSAVQARAQSRSPAQVLVPGTPYSKIT